MVTSYRILLVEDDPDRITLTRHALKDHDLDVGVDVTRTSGGALEALRSRGKSEVPDLVLLDLKLEGSSGFDVLRGLREDLGLTEIPVVVLTSSRERDDRETSYRLGANSYVTKPVDYEEFRQCLCRIATYWLTVNDRPA